MHGNDHRALLTGPQPQCIGLPAAEARQLFRYCLGLRGGGSSHFAPICTAELRRDQSSGGGGWDKCTECHINHGHQGLTLHTHTNALTHSHSLCKRLIFSQQPQATFMQCTGVSLRSDSPFLFSRNSKQTGALQTTVTASELTFPTASCICK